MFIPNQITALSTGTLRQPIGDCRSQEKNDDGLC